MELDAIVYGPNAAGKWSAEDLALIFSRLVIDGLIAGELTPELAGKWARQSAHYGLIALAEDELKTEAFGIIRAAFQRSGR